MSKYATAKELGHAAPDWVPGPDDADRVTSYWTYEDIYRNVKEAFDVILRNADGEEISRRYVPAARTIIEGTNRYLCKGMSFVGTVPPTVTLDPEAQAATMDWLKTLFAREEFGSKFLSLKRWTLIRGDGLLHISADPSKPEGSRLRITELSPEHYFPIFDPVDAERTIGAYLVTIVLDDEGEEIAQRMEYRRILSPEAAAKYKVPMGQIYYRMSFYETDGWDDRAPEFTEEDLKPVATPTDFSGVTLQPALVGTALPSQITSIPLYLFRNNREGTAPFGSSELQGIESLLGGIIQTTTDEDIAVALQGIGVYWTDSGRPRDDAGEEQAWEISPASMLELEKGGKVGRVDGGVIDTMIQHTGQLERFARQTTATSDVAIGVVDVQVAQSGIALAIQMMPTTAKNDEKEEDISNKLDQLLFDLLNGWGPAYEGLNAGGLVVTVAFSDPLPVNREAVVKEVTELVKNKVITVQYALQILKDKLGYDVDPAVMAGEIAAAAQQELDTMGARLDAAATGLGAGV